MTGDTDETGAGDDDPENGPPAVDADERDGSDATGRTDSSSGTDDPSRRDVDPERVDYLASELADLQEEVAGLESQVDEKTVHRDDIEAELRRYVRARQRKGHATGWGPYLVLLYGVVMTLGAFYYLGGIWAILAMLIVWLSTLGLYVFMGIFSTGITATRRIAALRNVVRRFR